MEHVAIPKPGRDQRKIMRLEAENAELQKALKDILPLAEDYLRSAPGHPDNAKLETARALLSE